MDLNYFNALMEQNTIIYRYEVTTIIVPTIKCLNVIGCEQPIFMVYMVVSGSKLSDSKHL